MTWSKTIEILFKEREEEEDSPVMPLSLEKEKKLSVCRQKEGEEEGFIPNFPESQ